MDYSQQREIMLQYLNLKVFLEDWHGVADAAMDLRELEAENKKHYPITQIKDKEHKIKIIEIYKNINFKD